MMLAAVRRFRYSAAHAYLLAVLPGATIPAVIYAITH